MVVQNDAEAADEHSQRNGDGSGTEASMPTAFSPLIGNGQNRSSDGANAADESVPFIDKDDGEVSRGPPQDKRKLVYLIILLHGIGILLPWNTFLTIGMDYFVLYKLGNVTDKESYKKDFFNYLTIFAQIPNLLLSLLNLFVVIKGGLYRRIYGSLAIISFVCVITILMIFVNTFSWPFGFFLVTMITIVVLNSANGIYQNSIWGLVADFPGEFTNAIVLGNNFCGILMVVLYIMIILLRVDPKISASIYFGLALLTVACCVITFHFLPKFEFYKYHTNKAAKSRLQQGTDVLHESEEGERLQKPTHPSLGTYIAILKEAWRQLLDVWLVFFTTLALFPTILLNIKLYPMGRDHDIFIYGDRRTSEMLFRQLTIFLNFNLFATVGSWLADHVQWPNPKYLSVPIVARLLFLPLFWFCNYDYGTGSREFVFIKNEWAFVLLVTFMAITHGYWSSLSMIYAPKQVDQSKSQIVGMMSGFFLVFGIAMGILFTFAEPSIVSVLERICHFIFS